MIFSLTDTGFLTKLSSAELGGKNEEEKEGKNEEGEKEGMEWRERRRKKRE